MKTNIQSIGFTASDSLTTFVKEKTAKLSLYFENIISSEVCLSIDKSNNNENKVCDIRLVIAGNDLMAKAQCKSFEEALADATDALVKQIEKRGRAYENSIRIDYLRRLNERYEAWISTYEHGKMLVIDIDEINFAENPEHLGMIVNRVNAELHGLF